VCVMCRIATAFDLSQTLQRLTFAGMSLWYGLEKLLRFRDLLSTFPDPLGIGHPASLIAVVLAQVPCAALVLVGFQTRVACVPLIIAMAVAAFGVHQNDPPVMFRHALVFALGFLALAVGGPGRFSVDHAFGRSTSSDGAGVAMADK